MSIECPVCHAVSHHPVDAATGWCSRCERFTGKTADEVRAAAHELKDAPVEDAILYRLHKYGASDFALDQDVVYPRDEDHRLRVYARRGKEIRVVACCAVDALGATLLQLDEDQRNLGSGGSLGDLGAIGVLDAVAARWLILPWHRPSPERILLPPEPQDAPYVVSYERLVEIRSLLSRGDDGDLRPRRGVTGEQLTAAIYDLLAERDERQPS